MPRPDCHYGRRLTGLYRVRRGFLSRLILQVQVENEDHLSSQGTKWIDATETDLWRLDAIAGKLAYQNLRDNRNGLDQ